MGLFQRSWRFFARQIPVNPNQGQKTQSPSISLSEQREEEFMGKICEGIVMSLISLEAGGCRFGSNGLLVYNRHGVSFFSSYVLI